MFSALLLTPILALLAVCASAELRLNVTAISARNGYSTLECWEMASPFYTSHDKATSGARIAHLGNVSTMSWAVAYPGQYVGPHNAPCNQWVVMLSGFAHISLPHDNSTGAYMTGGEYGILFAADTPDVSRDGHISTYLGTSETIFLQIPTGEEQPPEHKVLHMGPCGVEEMGGWRLPDGVISRPYYH